MQPPGERHDMLRHFTQFPSVTDRQTNRHRERSIMQ